MSATIEWLCDLCGVIRWHTTENSKIGDPYEKAATIYRHSRKQAEIMGMVGIYTRKQREELAEKLREEGISVIIAERIRQGDTRLKIIKVPEEKKNGRSKIQDKISW